MNAQLMQQLLQAQALQQQQGSQEHVFVSFRAGKMHHDKVDGGPKLRIVADRRRGEVRLIRDADRAVHFQWRNRATGNVEDDCLVFSGDKMKRIDSGNPQDRVYLLQLNSGRRMFFWMQEPKDDKDEELIEKLNSSIENPHAESSDENQQRPSSSSRQGIDASQLSQFFQSADTAAVSQALSSTGTQPAVESQRNDSEYDEEAELQRALELSMLDVGESPNAVGNTSSSGGVTETSTSSTQNSTTDTTTTTSGTNSSTGLAPASVTDTTIPAASSTSVHSTPQITPEMFQAAMQAMAPGGSNTRSLTSYMNLDDNMSLLLEDRNVERLLPFLPEQQRTRAHLQETLRSPQFRQTIRVLSEAVQTDNFDAVFHSFGLRHADGEHHMVHGNPIAAFIAAIIADSNRRGTASDETKEENETSHS